MRFCPSCGMGLERKLVDDQERLACARDCGFVHWDNPVPVVAAIIEYQGRVLLARNAAWPEDWFALVTGFLERGESPEEAVLREVMEEVGLAGEISGFVGLYPFFKQNQLLIVYHITADGEVSLGKEIADYKLEEKHDVRPWPMGTGPALRDWLRSQGVAVAD
jgi:NAD+ diphosphatase